MSSSITFTYILTYFHFFFVPLYQVNQKWRAAWIWAKISYLQSKKNPQTSTFFFQSSVSVFPRGQPEAWLFSCHMWDMHECRQTYGRYDHLTFPVLNAVDLCDTCDTTGKISETTQMEFSVFRRHAWLSYH